MITFFRTSSHYPLLIKAFAHSVGDVLELGTGLYSTPLLHWLAADAGRKLVSYENDWNYYLQSYHCRSAMHRLLIINDWDSVEVNREWGLAFIDHHPAERRVVDAIRLAHYTKLVVVHDTEPRYQKVFHFDKLDNYYQYRYDYKKFVPHTSVFSNFDNLEWLKG